MADGAAKAAVLADGDQRRAVIRDLLADLVSTAREDLVAGWDPMELWARLSMTLLDMEDKDGAVKDGFLSMLAEAAVQLAEVENG
jgi:hypothetical protein